jgi:hypothetical protein
MSAENEMEEGLTTVGLTNESHEILKQLKRDGIFKEMVDGYRFGIALAIAYGNIASEDIKTNTIFNIGTLDPDDKLQKIIIEFFPDATEKPYTYAERLAEWGVSEMGKLTESGELKFTDIFDKVQKLDIENLD